MTRRIALLLPLFTILSFTLLAQQFGGNPATLKWRQIDTDTARIIFPEGLEATANRVATVIHRLQQQHQTTIGTTLRKVNIVLQNQTTVSNAYVGLAPYRSEFYLFAPQDNFDLGTLNWADNLSLHEYRHVQQYSNFRVGLSKLMSYLLGQEGQAVANAASVPDWFFEGDAVFNETALSTNGRGRLPFFFKDYQSLLYGQKQYSYMKLRNGSLRHFVPDHYHLGYLLVAYGREKYGAAVWRRITQDAAAFKPLLYPLQGALKKHTGITYDQFVKDAFRFYQHQWQQAEVPDLHWLTQTNPRFVNHFRYPYVYDNGVVALEYGYRQIPRFVQIDSAGVVSGIAVRDIANDDYFSCNNGRIIYAGLKPDARWGYRQYSRIAIIDLKTRQRRTVLTRSRYFSPDIAHQGHRIVAIEMTPDQQSNIVVLDTTGKVLFTYKGDPQSVYTYPKFSANDQSVYVAVKNGTGAMALQRIRIMEEGAVPENIIPFGSRVIGLPVVQNRQVTFSASYQGRDEIWAYDEEKEAVYRLAGYPTGLYQAVFKPNREALVVSAFTASGYRLARIPAKDLLWEKIAPEENSLPDLYTPTALRQEDSAMLNQLPQQPFATSRYHKFTHPFNFHSWRPFYDEPEYSFSLYGQNILNTLQTVAGYTFNRNEGSHSLNGNLVYGAWYLQPFAGISQTWNRTVRYNTDTRFHYNESTGYVGLQLPLNFSGGRQYRYLTPSISVHRRQVAWTGTGRALLPDQHFDYVQGRLIYTGQIQKAVQQIFPRWAHTYIVQYRSILNRYTAHQLLATANWYLPALHVNHNLVLSAAFQIRDTANEYYFSNSFPFSRGYSAIDFPRMWRLGANYHLPLVYPDWGFGNLVYLLRVRANAFYDYTRGKSLRTGRVYPFRTAGIEMYLDTRWWNQQAVTFGIRYNRLLDPALVGGIQPNRWQIILPVNLFSYQ